MSSTAFLILLIKHAPSKPNFQAVADAEGMNKHSIGMRYRRLLKANETKTPSQSIEKGVKFLIRLIKHTSAKPDFQAVADVLNIKKHAAEMRYRRLIKSNKTQKLPQTTDKSIGGEDTTMVGKTKKRTRSSDREGRRKRRAEAADEDEDEVLPKEVELECSEADGDCMSSSRI